MKMVQNQTMEVSENFLRRYPDSSWDALERSDDQNYATIISLDGARFSLQNASYHAFFGDRIIYEELSKKKVVSVHFEA